MNQGTARPRSLRPEIQALRAVAVTFVLVYHFWPSVLHGGFVGVDVFFAISGFLITSHLLRELDRTGTVSMSAFWARRARRILPPALVVLLCCACATIAFVPLSYWQQFFSELRASTTYGQNWHLAAAAVDYLSQNDPPSPVQHFWSLSAEEQFYLVWPVLILLAVTVTRFRRVHVGRRSIAVVMAALTVVSLAYGIYTTTTDPAAAYFVTPTRAWEFGAGGLLALLPLWEGGRNGLRSLVSWLGLLAIVVAALTYSDATPFPGVAAVLPVAGSLLVIAAGAPSGRWAPTRPLSIRPLQFLGDISYSIYLWHLPLLVLAPFVLGEALNDETRLTLVMLTILAAWLTKLAIEDPVRVGPLLAARKARWTFAAAASGTAVVMAVSLWGASYVQAQIHKDERRTAQTVASKPNCFGAAARDPLHPCSNPALKKVVVPTPVEARDRPNAPCTILRGQPMTVCAFGVPKSQAKGTIALVGDSHASHWRAALAVVAREKSWHGVSITRSGCPFSRTVKKLRNPLQGQCVRWNRQVPAWLAKHREVSTIFVVQDSGSRWVTPAGQNPWNAQVAGWARAWKTLPRSIKHIVVIRDTPKDRLSTVACVEKAIASHADAGRRCAVPRSFAIDRDSEAVAAARLRSPRVRTVDLTRFFCDSTRCYPVIGGVLVHKDDHHMTMVFATTLGPYLLRAVDHLGLTTGTGA
jgi:peptidoglycan/LPS O-acetylase OafA/YrhL